MFATKLKAYTGHNAAVYALCLDGVKSILYSGDGDGNIVAWNIKSGEGLLVAKMPYSVFSLAFSLDKNLLFAGNNAGGVAFIDLNGNKIIKHVAHHNKGTFDILVLENTVYTVGGDGTCSIWNLETLKAEASIQLSSKNLRQVSWSEELQKLCIGASDGNVYFLSRDLSQVNYLKTVHHNGVFTAQISSDSNYLMSGGRDAQLRFQSIPKLNDLTSEIINFNFTTKLPAHTYTINSIIQNSKLPVVWISASRDRNIKIWEILPENQEKFKLLRVLTGIRDGGHVRSVNKLLPFNNSDSPHFEFFSAGDDKNIFCWQMKF